MNKNLFALILALIGIPCSVCLAQQPGTVLWSYNAGSPINTSPAIAPDGTIYIGTGNGLYAITNAGSNKWTFPIPVASSPAIASDGTVYFANNSGSFYALNPDGSQKWVHQFQTIAGSSPGLGADGTIYVAAEGRLCALAPDGTNKWKYFIGNEQCSPVIAPDGTIYIGNASGNTLFAVKPEDGTLKWAFDLASASGNSAAIGADGTIYVSGGFLYAVTANGTELWRNTEVSFQGASPAVGRAGTIYTRDDTDLTLYSINTSGHTNWNASTTSISYTDNTTPAIDASGMLYYCVSNSVFAITPQGAVQWMFSGPNAGHRPQDPTVISPAIGPDGTIYAAFGSTLYALKGTNGLGNTPWPMYRQNPRHTGKVEKPALQAPKKRADANFQFQLLGEVGQSYLIQRSTDLSLWSSLTNLVATNPPAIFIDLTASNFPATFYRAVLQ